MFHQYNYLYIFNLPTKIDIICAKNSVKNARWGIFGCGDVTERKSVPAYSKPKGFEFVAVMSRDALKAADYVNRHDISKFYSEVQVLIDNLEVDAVYMATPVNTNKFYALVVAKAGNPCCIEKPMATNFRECTPILEAFESKKLPLFVAYYRGSLLRFKQIIEWIDNCEIGIVRHASWYLSKKPSQKYLDKVENWRTDATIAVGVYFNDLASHGLNLLRYYFGDVIQVN